MVEHNRDNSLRLTGFYPIKCGTRSSQENVREPVAGKTSTVENEPAVDIGAPLKNHRR